MYLSRLDMYGFKSFADKIHIDFNKGITGIVGPNGSGKSNIADAIRWVLGEQSAKILRGSKMEDVIFSGAHTRKPLGFAEVSITIDNTDCQLPIDYSEVTVKRRVYRSGESEYYINSSTCRLKDIQQLFMDTGIGKEGYSIIGQGRIDEILSSNSAIRRKVFEEAAGIVKYKTRKQEAESKLEKTKNNITRVDDIISELEDRLEPLKEQSIKAKEFLNLRDRLKSNEINKFVIQYDSFDSKRHSINENLKQLRQDICSQKDQIRQFEEQKKNNEGNIQRIKDSLDQDNTIKYSLIQKVESIKGSLRVIDEKISGLETYNNRLKEDAENQKEQLKQDKLNLENEENLLNEQENKLETLKNELLDYDKSYNILDKEYKDYKENTSSLDNKSYEIKTTINKVKNDLSNKSIQKENIEERIANLNASLKNKQQDCSLYKEKLQQTQKSISVIKENLKANKNKRLELSNKVNTYKQKNDKTEDKLNKLGQDITKLKSRLGVLKGLKNDYEGFSSSVKTLLKHCKRDSDLNNHVCGVIADILDVPPGMETAIETALGRGMQNIVTDDEEDAKFIISYLKKNNIGRATFLPLSSISSRTLNNREQNSLNKTGVIGTASSIVKSSAKYKKVIDHLLGRIVIVDNIDTAVHLAKENLYSFRIVTCDGDVINPGGAITGGSRRRESTSIFKRNREIDVLEEQLNVKQEEFKNLTEVNRNYKEKLKDLIDMIKNENDKYHNIDKHKTTEDERLLNINETIKRLLEEVQELTSQKSVNNTKKDEVEASISELQKQLSILQEQNKEYICYIDDRNRKSEKYLEELQDLKEKATNCRVDVAAQTEKIVTIKNNINAHKTAIDSSTKSIKHKVLERNNNLGSIEEYKEEKEKFTKTIQELQKEIEQKNNIVNTNNGSLREIEITNHSIEQQIEEIRELIEDTTDKYHRHEVRLTKLQTELDNIQKNIWDEYEISYATAKQIADPYARITQINSEIKKMKQKISDLGEVNVTAIQEYKDVSERYSFLTKQKTDLIEAEENLKEVIRDITITMKKQFADEFILINDYFSSVFQKLFGGGKASLVLQDKNDILNCDIEIVAQPPGKKLQNISLLSGGERSLTAIAIMFAILERKPAPFCILDEIEAALDDTNAGNFGQLLNDFSEKTQFVVITHRKKTMEISNVLYGVTMQEKGISQLVSVKLEG